MAVRWAVVILWLGSLVAHAAPQDFAFHQTVKQAEEARLADRLPEAVQLYKKAVGIKPAWSEGWWWLGSIYYDQDLYVEAHAAFAQAFEQDHKLTPALAFLALCEYEQRDTAAARAHLRQWLAAGAPGDAQMAAVAHYRWRELLIQEGRFPEALYLLNHDATVHGPSPALIDAMGLAWLQIRSLPEEYPPAQREMIWLAGSAAAWMSASKLDRCREDLDRLAAHYGNQPHVHFLRGFVFESMRDDTAAIDEYRQEVALSAQDATARTQLALLLAESAQPDEALRWARQAEQLDPENARSHFAMGRALMAAQNWADSAAELEKARSLAPRAPRIRFQLARVYRKLNRNEEAGKEEAAFEALNHKEDGPPEGNDPSSLSRSAEERGR
jgi:tetratricopeptide (TPR) repeat protein